MGVAPRPGHRSRAACFGIMGSAAGDWQAPLCGCFDDMEILATCMCAPLPQIAKNQAIVERKAQSYFDYAIALFCAPCLLFITRGALREQHDITGNMVFDCCTVLCCAPCSLAQSTRELKM